MKLRKSTAEGTVKRRRLAAPAVLVVVGLAIVLGLVFRGGDKAEKTADTAAVKSEAFNDEVYNLYGAGKYKLTIAKLKERLEDSQLDGAQAQSLRSLLASSYWRLGDFESSYKEYRVLLREKPDDPELMYLLSLAAKELDKPDEALDYMEKAAEAKADSPQFQSRLARLYRQREKYQASAAAWQKLLDGFPPGQVDKVEVYAELAAVYLDMGDGAKAREAVSSGLALSPDDERLRELEDKL